MASVTAAILAISFAATTATAQVDKPRPLPTDRLPAPARITAQQMMPGGPIRVRWSSVDGAVRYIMTRSVPPTPAAQVPLRNSPDTVYIDFDVKPGSSYYYLISAVNESGTAGMRASAPPVAAVARARPPETPAGIRAVLTGRAVELSWQAAAPDESYRIERETGTAPGSNRVRLADRNQCCRIGDQLDNVSAATPIRYYVTAMNSAGMRSSPGVSNEITIPPEPGPDTTGSGQPTDTTGGAPADSTAATSTNVRPAVVPAPARLKVGATLDVGRKPFFTSLGLQKVRWVSLDDSKATVDSRGKVLGKAVGYTYVIATGLTRAGAVASVVQRVDVIRK